MNIAIVKLFYVYNIWRPLKMYKSHFLDATARSVQHMAVYVQLCPVTSLHVSKYIKLCYCCGSFFPLK